MTLIDLISGLRETYKDGLTNSSVMKEYYIKSEEDLDRITRYLTSLFLGDTEVQKLISDNDMNGLVSYIESIKKDLDRKYEWLLSGFGDTEFIGAIKKKDFNEMYREVKEAKEYHDKYTYQEHMGKNGIPKSEIEGYSYSETSVSYQNWDTLLKEYYESVMKGDFSGIINLYNTIQILPGMIFLVGRYEWDSRKRK